MKPQEFFREAFQPLLKAITHAIDKAPLSDNGRAELALSTACYTFGVAISALEVARTGITPTTPSPLLARWLAEQIIATIERGDMPLM